MVYVDDEPHNLLATSSLLTRWQCQVTGLESIAAARHYIKQAIVPDLLLMDYQLDEADVTGIELAQELIAQWQPAAENGDAIPVCIISAATDVDLPKQVSQAGFEFLRKPVKPGRMRALLTQIKQRRDHRGS